MAMSAIEKPGSVLADAQRFAAIVEFSDDAIISKDLNGVITSWNPGAERIFGYSAEEVIGKPVTILIPPERQDEEPGILERIRLEERIRALANVHTLFVQSRWIGAELRSLIKEELRPYSRGGAQTSIEGPKVLLAQDAAQTIAMAVHELAT